MLAKTTAVFLSAAMVVSGLPGKEAEAAKKPKLSKSKISVRIGETKRVTIKNAKKVKFKMKAKAKKIVKVTKKSAKGFTVKGRQVGKAKINVTMINGKKKVKKTVVITVKAAKTTDQTKTPKTSQTPGTSKTPEASKNPEVSQKPENSQSPQASDVPKSSETPEPSKNPEASQAPETSESPEASKAPEASQAPTEAPKALVLEGEALGESADFTYKANGAAQYQSVGIFEIDKTNITKDSTIALTYEAKEGSADVTDSQKFNVGLKTGDKWNSPAVCDVYNQAGGKIEISIDEAKMEKINAGEKLYMHVSTATAGFKGTFTYKGVTCGEQSLVNELPSSYTYVESGMNQYAATAKVNLPADIDFSKYKTCRIDFTSTDLSFEFHGIVGQKADGAEVTDPKYGVTSKGVFEITLDNVLKQKGTDPFVVINAGQAGFKGKVKILRVALLPEGVTVPDITIEPLKPEETQTPSQPETPGVESPKTDTPDSETKNTEMPEETKLILEGSALGEGASFAYVPNGFAAYSSMGIFEIDKTKLSAGCKIVLNYTAVEGETDVKNTQGFNIGLKTGDKWNSPAILDAYGKTGGNIEIEISEAAFAKIGSDDKVYMHVSTGTAGFKGTFTYESILVNGESVVTELPKSVSYVESGMSQYAPTAKVYLPSDFDFTKYSTCRIEFTASDPSFEFHGIVGHKVNGAEVTDPKYGVDSEGVFTVNLDKVKNAEGTNPYVVINAGKAGYTGSVTITKIIFEK